ncbi:hypothetical protein [Arcanobacterium hippocoleae]|uniref:Uncharacterized protein n=1 Tax=Arcanobacterium hippocoleae TaxID=149017 RepID=A0ABU1T2X5_9ACTO|nr:hypothetical protein [Arcanobacterium hippocoleae]MDR6939737.1 hypothetical protein [Arcanobacterium hippocoleae]
MFSLYSVTEIPLTRQVSFDPQVVAQEANVDRVGALTASRVWDVNALSGFRGDLESDAGNLLGAELRQAIERRIFLWLDLIDVQQFAKAQEFFGADVVVRAGAICAPEHGTIRRYGDVRDVVPVAVNPAKLLRRLVNGTPEELAWVRKHLDGIDSKAISSANFKILIDAQVNIIVRSLLHRAMYSPTFIAYAVVFIYSSLRALPVVFVPHFQGNIWVLWGIDVISAIPYTWGLIEIFRGRTWLRRVAGLVVTIVTFMAPYIYFWMHGRHYPASVNLIVAGMILGAILIELYRWQRDKEVRKVLAKAVLTHEAPQA